MSESSKMLKAVSTSNTYKLQLKAIRLRLWDLDEMDAHQELNRKQVAEYKALEAADKRVLAAWRESRTKNGLSNEAVN